jgi:hypothetical protein
MNREEKILWYWSGEADDGLSIEIEGLLESDSKAREFFDELGELAIALTDGEIPARREGLLDEVFESRPNVLPFSTATMLALVATLVVAGFATFLMGPGSGGPELAKEKPSHATSAPVVPLSERILSDSGSFRSRQGGLEENNRQRRRWKKIRNPRKRT